MIAQLQRWLGALAGSSRVSEEGFPRGRARSSTKVAG